MEDFNVEPEQGKPAEKSVARYGLKEGNGKRERPAAVGGNYKTDITLGSTSRNAKDT